MTDLPNLSTLSAEIAPGLVTVKNYGDASFISLPMVYPSGAFVTVRLGYAAGGIRVSDSGFAYREIESFGAMRSFANTARTIAEEHDVEAGRREVFVDVPVEHVERAIFDVSAASKAIADRIVANASQAAEIAIEEMLQERLERVFPAAVEFRGRLAGASATEWDLTAIARPNGRVAVFHAVPNYPVAVFKASTAFHDLAALPDPPSLIAVVRSRAEMGPANALLAQAGRVIEIDQADEAFSQAAA
ncbi:hypothetical protein [Salinarimonas ramus]|uniref:DUF1828 domain-containing protein n=1 Tax=Salinarimonas ramus TaxID=690164 RepID=A0A917QJJ4_9HYPH|nr:hypothetical protein [Salinarimonas ramus]GGK53787.1 hypothetical protein GCM10011322_45750 [Salinarimonas ramus]